MSATTTDRLISLTIHLEQQPEGGYTATAPQLPGLVTEGDTVAEAMANVEDALAAFIELYEDTGKEMPLGTAYRKSCTGSVATPFACGS